MRLLLLHNHTKGMYNSCKAEIIKPGLWATKTTGSSLAVPGSSPTDRFRRADARRRRETEKSEKIEETFMSKRAVVVVAQVVEWQRCALTTPSSIPLSAGLFFYFCHVLKQEVKCFHTKKNRLIRAD